MEEVPDLPTSVGDQISVRPISVGGDGLGYVIVSPEYPEPGGFDAHVFGGQGSPEQARYSGVSAVIWLDGIEAPFE